MYFGIVDKDNKLMRVSAGYDNSFGKDTEMEFNISNKVTLSVFTATDIETARKVCAGDGDGSMSEPYCTYKDLKVVQLAINITASY